MTSLFDSLCGFVHPLALDRLSVFQVQCEDAALAGVVVDIAFPGGQAVESRLDESQLFEPIQGLGGEDEDAGHADPLRLLDEVRENLSPHAQVTVGGIRGNRGDFTLAFPIIVKGCTSTLQRKAGSCGMSRG